ncbi:MAG: biliverdin-producing heme oxygenase [Campylobacterota bacterium]
MNSTNTFHQRLKDETKQLHDALEQLYITKSLVEGTITTNEYKEYLKRLHCMHAVIERQLIDFDWQSIGIDIERYLRKELVQNDLKSLEVDFEQTQCKKIDIENFEQALGFLYVLTGSTMGGKILAQKVEQNPSLPNVNSYFHAFEEDTMGRWMEFLQKFSSYVEKNKADEAVLEGAKKCYGYVKECLDG